MSVPRIHENACKGCGLCVAYCPKDALVMSRGINSRGVHYVVSQDPEKCTGCGICYQMCPDAAIEVVADGRQRSA